MSWSLMGVIGLNADYLATNSTVIETLKVTSKVAIETGFPGVLTI